EFLGGKWQPSRTSDPNNPLPLMGGLDPSKVGDLKSSLRLSALYWPEGADPPANLRVIVSFEGSVGSSFYLYKTFSVPALRQSKKEPHFSPKRSFTTAGQPSLVATYSDTVASHTILDNSIEDGTVDPHHPTEGNSWEPPFFYEDSRHVFYVTS